MTEKLLHFIWQFQHFNRQQLATFCGQQIQIIYPGQINYNQGPDFSEAKIIIEGTTLVGSVELHIKTSDWEKHKHSGDDQYKNVILHVVYQHDSNDKPGLPVLELAPRIPLFLLQQYNWLMNNQSFIPCNKSIGEIKEIIWVSWKERLVAERLMRKTKYILSLLEKSQGHWEETLWWITARNFGIRHNSEVFEELAQTIPVTILAKHKESIVTLEALLLGQSGLLNRNFTEDYTKLLQREFRFHQHKYNLPPVHATPLFMRMRPVNFPTVRLAQLAMLIHNNTHLFATIKDAVSVLEVRKLFAITANDYWHYHYVLDEPSAYLPKKVGAAMVDNILINSIIPILFAYGHYHKKDEYKQKALQWLQETSAEINNITKGFKNIALSFTCSFDTQALIELKTQYCDARRCLECSVGNALLKKTSA